MLEKSYKSKGFLCFYSQTLKWQGQKNRSDSKFFKNPDFCCQSNSRKCMKAVFLLLNRRLLRGSDRKNRLFFRFCCFCSLKKQKKQGVESVFAVKGEKQGQGQGARYVAESRRRTREPKRHSKLRPPSKPERTRQPRRTRRHQKIKDCCRRRMRLRWSQRRRRGSHSRLRRRRQGRGL